MVDHGDETPVHGGEDGVGGTVSNDRLDESTGALRRCSTRKRLRMARMSRSDCPDGRLRSGITKGPTSRAAVEGRVKSRLTKSTCQKNEYAGKGGPRFSLSTGLAAGS